AHSDVHIGETRSQKGHDGNHQNEKGEDDYDIDDDAENSVKPFAVVAGNRAHNAADDKGHQRRKERDLHVDARRPDHARENIAAEIVGTEKMLRARRLQNRLVVKISWTVRRDESREKGHE